MPNTFIITL